MAEQEATEDFHRVGFVGPIRTSLKDATVGFLYRRRIGWLLALVFMNIFSGAGIAYFEETTEPVRRVPGFRASRAGDGGWGGETILDVPGARF